MKTIQDSTASALLAALNELSEGKRGGGTFGKCSLAKQELVADLETLPNPVHAYRAAYLETKYLGPTNFRGSRVKVTLPHWAGGDRKALVKILSWDYAASNDSGHNCDMVAIVEKALGIKCECYVQTERGHGIIFKHEDWKTVRDWMTGEKGWDCATNGKG